MFTLDQAKESLKKLGITINKKDGEYRVNFKDGKEETAYYTNSLVDAVHTGIDMAAFIKKD